jgi:hypothetical protein
MSLAELDDGFLWRLQRQLPLPAYARPVLMAFLRTRIANIRIAPRLRVTNMFRASEAGGLLCRFIVEETAAGQSLFVAPIEQLAFYRGHPIAREIVVCRQRRPCQGKA